MNDLISVVLPVHNAENFISTCIESVVGQTYRPIELIVVDDGSSDGTLAILHDIQCKYPEIMTVISQENHGVSSARNHAITIAHGDYLSFIDSDDEYKPDYLEQAISLLRQHNSQMMIAPFDLIVEKEKTSTIHYLANQGECISINDYLDIMLTYHDQAYWGANWNKLYIASIIHEHHIVFQDNVSIGEDFYFNLQYLKYVKNVAVLNKSTYCYRVDTAGSISKAKRNPKNYWGQYVLIYHAYQELLQTLCLQDKSRQLERFAQIMARHTLYLAHIINGCTYSEFSELFQIIRESQIVFGKKANVEWRTSFLTFCLQKEKTHWAYWILSCEKTVIKYLRRNSNG